MSESAFGTVAPPPGAFVYRGPDFPGNPSGDRECHGCRGNEQHGNDPRHIVTTPGGDHVWHMDCHAEAGCDQCREILHHHDGSVKGKGQQVRAQQVPHHADIEPGEFVAADGGVHIRRRFDRVPAAVRGALYRGQGA